MRGRLAFFLTTSVFAGILVGCAPAGENNATIGHSVEFTALQYFRDHAHPETGLVRDYADNFKMTLASNRVSSIAATGFGLTVIANAAKRGLITSAEGYEYALKTLRFVRDHVPRRKGWFVHFADWETGKRKWESEFSTIDTALFLAGALYAAAVYPDTEVATIARELYRDVDFEDAMTDGGSRPNKRTLSMAYEEKIGYTPAQWNMYAEQIVLLILGLGHPTKPLPTEAWLAWQRKTMDADGEPLMGLDQALFVHQYSQLFLDLREFRDMFSNYHNNGRQISRVHRRMALRSKKYRTLSAGFWGFSAGDAPNDEYRVYTALDHTSTVCIGCAVASTMYMPQDLMKDMKAWMTGPFQKKVWGRYGFTDSVDLDRKWFSTRVFGITVGPAYMSVANLDEKTSIWHDFMTLPEIQVGLRRAGVQIGAPITKPSPRMPDFTEQFDLHRF